MEKQQGIVLKKYSPHKQKLTIFDYNLGKIEAVYTHDTAVNLAHHGSLIDYFLERRSTSLYLVHNVQVQTMPLQLAQHDINFLHHILELSYHFLPFDSAHPEVFEVLQKALFSAFINKAIILLRFFTSLGIYPEELPFEKNYFHRLLSDHFETILKEKFNESQLENLDLWLTKCKELHPNSKNFKTTYPLTRYDDEKKYFE